MKRGLTRSILLRRFEAGTITRRPDELIVEEPLSIQLDGNLVATTMRTPGNDFELAAGFACTERLLADATIDSIRYCAAGSPLDTEFNVVSVDTGGLAPEPQQRMSTMSSSCGICGRDAIDELLVNLQPVHRSFVIEPEVLLGVAERVRTQQTLFASTGSVHAAAAFDASGSSDLVREDIGRHNAVDKVIGRLLLDARLPATNLGLYVSGRASFEIVQKAWVAGFGTIVSVSAPSSLAVELAIEANIALAGFVRGDALNLYT
ncbi:MAG: formate dehydrogenase accessory sulfurtransferase FdhD [Acidobacteria bacterium]|nr:formate dehydrogenase accessory sulfurtransferase FdhD [Acidobacteriota bacterium]